jgi:hypothetical protein
MSLYPIPIDNLPTQMAAGIQQSLAATAAYPLAAATNPNALLQRVLRRRTSSAVAANMPIVSLVCLTHALVHVTL